MIFKLFYRLEFLIILISVFNSSLLCQEINPQDGLFQCGTDIDTFVEYRRIKNKKSITTLIKKTGTVLYAPFKFKGESDPSLTDMNAVKEFFLKNSYGIYALQITFAPLIELPYTRTEDLDDSNISWVKTLNEELKRLGYEYYNYDYYIRRTHAGKPFTTINRGGGAWLTIKSSAVACHEIGHSLYSSIGFSNSGVSHANLWVASNLKEVIGVGSSKEYGNRYSIMGDAFVAEGDFSLIHKINVEWIKPSEYFRVYKTGIYRIYPHDRGVKQSGRKYGIKINKSVTPFKNGVLQYYFVEFKNNSGVPEENPGLLLTVLDPDTRTQLLDNNPGANNHKDEVLEIGRAFRDIDAGITVRALSSGGSGSDAWIRVKVVFDDQNSTELPVDIAFNTPLDQQVFTEGTDIHIALDVHPIKLGNIVQLEIENVSIKTIQQPYILALDGLPKGVYRLKATVSNNENQLLVYDEISIRIDGALGIDDLKERVFLVSPNPITNNEMTIQNLQGIQIENIIVYNTLGEEVYSEKIATTNRKITLNLNLVAGIYFVKTITGKGNFSKKIIVK